MDKKRKCITMVNNLITSYNLMSSRISSYKDLHHGLICNLFSAVMGVGSDFYSHHPVSMYKQMMSHLSGFLDDDLSYMNNEMLAGMESGQMYCLLEILTAIHKFVGHKSHSKQSSSQELSCIDMFSLRSPCLPSSSSSSTTSVCSCCSCSCIKGRSYSGPCQEGSMTGSFPVAPVKHESPTLSTREAKKSKEPKLIDAREKRKQILHQQLQKSNSSRRSSLYARHQSSHEMPNINGPFYQNTLLYELRKAKEYNFALELGYRLHNALRLEEDTQMIERKINRLNNDIHSFDQQIEPCIVQAMMKKLAINQPIQSNFRKSAKGKVVISDAIRREKMREAIIRKEIDHQESLRRNKRMMFNRMSAQGMLRDERMERAKTNRLASDLQSQYVRHDGVDKPADVTELDNRNAILEVKAGLRERDEKEVKESKHLLEAYENLYESKRQMLRDRLQQEEEEMRQRSMNNRHMLSQIRKEINDKIGKAS